MSWSLSALPARLASPTARGSQGMIVSPPKSGLEHNTALWLASLCRLLLCLCVWSWPSPYLRLCPTPLPAGLTLPLKVLAPLLPDGGRTLRLRSWSLPPSHCPLPQLSCVTAHTEDFKLKAVILTFPGAPGALFQVQRDIVANAGP